MSAARRIQQRESRPQPVEIPGELGGAEKGANVDRRGHQQAALGAADRRIERRRQIGATEVAVAVQAEIDDVVVKRALDARGRRPHQHAVLVVVRTAVLAVAVVGDGRLRREAVDQRVLAVEIGDQYVIVPERLRQVVEAAVGVLLDPAEVRQVVLVAVVGARPEQARAQLVVLEQETAEIARERLDADAQRIEVEALGHVSEMLVGEQRLDTQE